MNIILFSQLNTFSESDSEVTSLKDKKDEFIMLVVQLYMSIYGLTNRGMYRTILNAPEQTGNPINHLVYILELYKYQSSSMYYQHIFEVLKLLEVVAQTIYLYDHIDHRHGITTYKGDQQQLNNAIMALIEKWSYFNIHQDESLPLKPKKC